MEAATATATDPLATYDTAVSCLKWLRAEAGDQPPDATPYERDPAAPHFIPMTRVVALVREFGFGGELARLDWSGLHRRGFSAPILVRLASRNLALVVGGSRGEVEEVAVWDPLDPDLECRYVGRPIFERAWSGHAIVIRRRVASRAPRRPTVAAPLRPRLGLAAAAIAATGIAAFATPPSLIERLAALLGKEPIRIAFVAPQAPAPAADSEAESLLGRGDGLLRQGDVAGARALYERAAAAGLWRGAVLAGATYDPAVLARRHLAGTAGDLVAARAWYDEARALGASDSDILRILDPAP